MASTTSRVTRRTKQLDARKSFVDASRIEARQVATRELFNLTGPELEELAGETEADEATLTDDAKAAVTEIARRAVNRSRRG